MLPWNKNQNHFFLTCQMEHFPTAVQTNYSNIFSLTILSIQVICVEKNQPQTNRVDWVSSRWQETALLLLLSFN